MKGQKGFTLIELMIVVAIIGILASVAVPQYQDYVARTKVSDPLKQMDSVKTMLADFYSDFGTMPVEATAGAGKEEIEAAILGLTGSDYVAKAEYANTATTATMTITFANSGSSVNGKTQIFAFDGTGPTFTMTCTGGDLPVKFRSSACR